MNLSFFNMCNRMHRVCGGNLTVGLLPYGNDKSYQEIKQINNEI